LIGDGGSKISIFFVSQRRRRLKNFQVLFVFDDGGWKNSIFFWFSAAVSEIFHGFFQKNRRRRRRLSRSAYTSIHSIPFFLSFSIVKK
jgi:hypothetical protein